MAVNYSYFIARFPEFASLDQAFVEFYISEAKKYVNARVWREKTDYAWALYAAHMIALLSPSQLGGAGGVGVLQSETSGDLSHSFAIPQGGGAGSTIALTKYGTLFNELMQTLDDIGPRVLI